MDQDKNEYSKQQDLIRGIILFGFSLLLFQLIVSGNIKYYIAPKMIVFSIIAMLILFVLSVMKIIRSCFKSETMDMNCDCGVDHQATGRPWLQFILYGVFILPVLTGFTLPQKFLDSAVAENRGVQLNFNSTLSPAVKTTESTLDSSSAQPVNGSLQTPEHPVKQEAKKSPEDVFKEARYGKTEAEMALKLYKQDTIRISDEKYVEDLSTINLYLDQFMGKKLELTGFIYRDQSMKKDETVVARFAVACCTADATVFGLDVKGSQINTFSKDTWVKVQGTLDQMEVEGVMVPMLHVNKVEKVTAPRDPYVY